jgi:hypothetical protein
MHRLFNSKKCPMIIKYSHLSLPALLFPLLFSYSALVSKQLVTYVLFRVFKQKLEIKNILMIDLGGGGGGEGIKQKKKKRWNNNNAGIFFSYFSSPSSSSSSLIIFFPKTSFSFSMTRTYTM